MAAGTFAGMTTNTGAPGSITQRQVAAAVVGNALEFYDFTTYAYFATQIGHAFFPSASAFVSLLLSLITFGVGFVLRPLGAVVIGRYADRHGRKSAMLLSFALMGVGILGLALTPGYVKIGLAAPILVVIWRLCQGFALGGEVGATTAYLIESAPATKRALYAAWQNISQNLAAIVGGLVGLTLTGLLGTAALDAWGWRIAFILGALVLPAGLWLRRDLAETLHHEEQVTIHQPAVAGLWAHRRIIFLGLALIAASTVSNYVLTYMTTYARETLHMGASISLAAPIANGAAGAVFGLLGGWLADRYGRKHLLFWPRLAFVLLAWPAFALMVRYHNAAALLAGTFVLSATSAMIGAALYTAISESLRKEVRGLVFGSIYAIAVAVFGGTTQPMIAWLVHVTANPLAPMWYALAFGVIGLVAAALIRETAPVKTSSVASV